jgi:hypothetical protein
LTDKELGGGFGYFTTNAVGSIPIYFGDSISSVISKLRKARQQRSSIGRAKRPELIFSQLTHTNPNADAIANTAPYSIC